MENQEFDKDSAQDIEAVCVDKGEPFKITVSEQAFYAGKGLTLPKRCKACREIKRQKNAASENRP